MEIRGDLLVKGKVITTGTPSEDGDLATKGYVDAQSSGGGGGGFYGIYLRESDDNPPAFRNDTIIFDSAYFYLSSNSVGKPTVSLREVPDVTGITSLSASWKFDTSTAAADPGNKKFRLNSATLSAVTNIYLNDTTNEGFDISTLAAFISAGQRVYVQQVNDAGRAVLFAVSGAPVDGVGFWTIPVTTVADSGVLFQSNQDCRFIFTLSTVVGADHGTLTGLGDDDHPQYLLRTQAAPGFYGVYFRESDGNPPTFRNDTVIFDSDYFYLQANSVGKPIVSLRPPASSGSGVTAHSALTGLSADDHSQYLLATDATSRVAFAANWLDLTDGGATTLHSHATASADPGFYGVVWSDGRVTKRTDRLSFNGAQFYMDGSKPTVMLGDNQTFQTITLKQYVEYADLAATPTSPAVTNMRVYGANVPGSTHSSLYTVDSDGTIINVLRDQVIVVKNSTGSSIAVGKLVSFSGSTGNIPNVVLAQASARTTTASGITMEAIADNATGRVLVQGVFTGVDLSAFAEGNLLYLSSSVAGGLTTTEPTHPNLSQEIGRVLRANANGILTVSCTSHGDGDDYGTLQANYTIGPAAASSVILQPASTAQRTATFQDKSGTIAYTSDIGPGFYGIYFQESDGNPPTFRNDTIIFDSQYFYLQSNSVNKPIISLRPSSSGGISNVVEDTSPQLGGDLDVNDFTIIGTNILLNATAQIDLACVGILTINADYLTMNGSAISDVLDPTGPQDAATKAYVDANSSGAFYGITTLDGTHNITNKTKINYNGGGFYLSQTSAGDPMVNLKYDKDIYPIYVDFPTTQQIAVDTCAQYSYTIEKVDFDCFSGSMTGGFYIITAINRATARDGTKVTNLDPLNFSTVLTTKYATGANTVNPGDIVQFSIYQNSSARRARVTLVCKKS